MFSDPEEYEKWKARGWRAAALAAGPAVGGHPPGDRGTRAHTIHDIWNPRFIGPWNRNGIFVFMWSSGPLEEQATLVSKVPRYRVQRVAASGIVGLPSGVYTVVAYLDPEGQGSKGT